MLLLNLSLAPCLNLMTHGKNNNPTKFDGFVLTISLIGLLYAQLYSLYVSFNSFSLISSLCSLAHLLN